jgi:hypothetical protein
MGPKLPRTRIAFQELDRTRSEEGESRDPERVYRKALTVMAELEKNRPTKVPDKEAQEGDMESNRIGLAIVYNSLSVGWSLGWQVSRNVTPRRDYL